MKACGDNAMLLVQSHETNQKMTAAYDILWSNNSGKLLTGLCILHQYLRILLIYEWSVDEKKR